MRALHRELGWVLSSTAMVRKHLAYLEPAQPRAGAFNQGLYSACLSIEATQRLHIIRALESRRICYRLLAHAASHLPDGCVFVLFHPLLQIIQDMHQAPDAIGEQR